MNLLKNALRALPLLVLLLVATTGCEPSYTEYYVRYVVGVKPGDTVNVTYQDTNNKTPTISQTISETSDETTVEAIVGPLYGGFGARLTASVNGGQAPEFIRIEASENGAPYVTKVEQKGSTSISWAVPLEEDK